MSPDQLATKADIIRLTDLMNILRQELKKQNQEQQKRDRIFTRQKLADHLGISLSTVDKLTRDKELPSFKIGGNVRYRESQILQALEELQDQKPTISRKLRRNFGKNSNQ